MNKKTLSDHIDMMGNLYQLIERSNFISTTTQQQTNAIKNYCSIFERVGNGNAEEFKLLVQTADVIIKGIHSDEVSLSTFGGNA